MKRRAIVWLLILACCVGIPAGGQTPSVNKLPFTVVTPNNPVPSLTSISPTNALAGGAGFTLTVTGTNFIASSVVRWNGVSRTTTFISNTQLSISVSSTDIAAIASIPVTVTTPGPGGGTAGPITFLVAAAAPSLTLLTPATITTGSPSFPLQVIGKGFLNGAIITFDATNLPTNFVAATTLTTTVPAALVQAPATHQVGVINPGSGVSPPIVSTSSLPAANQNVSYSTSLAVTGGQAPYTWTKTAGTLPTGLTLSSSGVISGTPTTPGTQTGLIFQVQDSALNSASSLPLSLQVIGTLGTLTNSLPGGTQFASYTTTLQATGGVLPYSWAKTAGTLPAGLTVSSSGVISGTPTAAGTATGLVFQVSDSASHTASTSPLSLTITAATGPTVTTSSLPSGTQNVSYSTTLAATGGTTPYTWTKTSGTLPAGLSLASNGVISGTPTVAGTQSGLVFTATDANGLTGSSSSLSITIASSGTLTVTTNSLSTGQQGQAYSVQLSAANGTVPYTWSQTAGSLPNGITLSSTGLLSGTPTVNGSFTGLVFRVTDNTSTTADSPSLTMTINTASSSNLYIGPVGGGDGSSCGSQLPISFFNNGTNWGALAGMISPGTVVHLCGTNTGGATNAATYLTFQGNGTSGNSITLQFESSAILQAGYWNANGGAINMNGKSFVGIDGGGTGVLQNTANGTASNHASSTLIFATQCNDCFIRNLELANTYVRAQNDATNGVDQTQVRAAAISGSRFVFSGNKVHDCGFCIQNFYSDGDTGVQVYLNDFYRMDHGYVLAANAANHATNFYMHDNKFHDTANWDAPGGCPYHHDGLHTYSTNLSSTMDGFYYYNNNGFGDWGTCPTGFVFAEGGSGTPSHLHNTYWWNNVFVVPPTAGANTNGWFGIFSGEAPGVTQVLYNSFYGGSGTNNGVSMNVGSVNNLTLKGNMVDHDGQLANIGSLTNTPASQVDYNFYGYGCQNGNNCFVYNGSFMGNFANWKATSGFDAHSPIATQNNTNQHISSTDASPSLGYLGFNAGVNLQGLATGPLVSLSLDTTLAGTRTATARPSGSTPWTIGAYQ